MNRIRSVDADSATIVADAGVILSNVHDAALEHGLRFPLTLGAKGSATIGGLVSTNAGGTQVLRFGTMRRLVLGVEAGSCRMAACSKGSRPSRKTRAAMTCRSFWSVRKERWGS